MPNPASVLTPGDITAPPVPTTTVVPYGRGLQVTVGGITRPSDFKEFYTEKRISAPAGSATAFANWRSGDGTYTDYETVYGNTYEYRSLSVDTSNNVSAFGNTGSSTPNQLTGGDIANASINNAHIINAEILNAHIRNGNIDHLKIANGEVWNINIANAAIDRFKVLNGEIINAKIGDLQVDSIKIAGSAVITDKILIGSVTQSVYAHNLGGSQNTTSTVEVKYGTLSATLTPYEYGTRMTCSVKCECSLTNTGGAAINCRGELILRTETGANPGPSALATHRATVIGLPPGQTISFPMSFTHVDGPRDPVSTRYALYFRIQPGFTGQVTIADPSLQVTEIRR